MVRVVRSFCIASPFRDFETFRGQSHLLWTFDFRVWSGKDEKTRREAGFSEMTCRLGCLLGIPASVVAADRRDLLGRALRRHFDHFGSLALTGRQQTGFPLLLEPELPRDERGVVLLLGRG